MFTNDNYRTCDGLSSPKRLPFAKIKKVFLLIGICSFLAAGGLIAAKGHDNPFDRTRKWWLANPKYHGNVVCASFSPDGEKLVFAVRNESGINSARDVYLYGIDDRKMKKLSINNFDGYISWSPDSRYLAFNQPEKYNRYIYIGLVYDTKLDTVTERFKIPFGGWNQPWSPDGKWQLFQTQLHSYIKEVGRPAWVEPSDEGRNHVLYWNYNGEMLIWYQDKAVSRYNIKQKVLDVPIYVTEFEVYGLLYCSPYSNEAYVLTSRTPDDHGRVVVRKLDLDAGRFTYSFDSGLDSKVNSLGHPIFIAPQNNLLYYAIYQYEIKGKVQGETPKLVRLNIETGQTETVLSGGYRAVDYCGKRNMFAVISKEDDYKALHLFDVETGTFTQVFP